MGLAMVKKIIEQAGGTISVESDEGEGSCFIFTWPVTSLAAGRQLVIEKN